MNSEHTTTPQVFIIPLGSPYVAELTGLLTRIGVTSAIVSSAEVEARTEQDRPEAVILAGGNNFITEKPPIWIPECLFDLPTPTGRHVPLLLINYCMRIFADGLDGRVAPTRVGENEYRMRKLSIRDEHNVLFNGITGKIDVMTSRGDRIFKAPSEFRRTAEFESASGTAIAAMEFPRQDTFGLNFHPEAPETVHGEIILANFCRWADCAVNVPAHHSWTRITNQFLVNGREATPFRTSRHEAA